MSTVKRVRIPGAFFEDYRGRWPGVAPTPIRQQPGHVWLRPTDPFIPDFFADALHYASEGPYMGHEAFGLVSSARATVAALEPYVGNLRD